jgi:hypothetical protein
MRDWALAAAPVLAAFGVAYLHFTSPPPAISLASYERIAPGMTEAEVEQVIRARPGGYGPFWGPGETARWQSGAAARSVSWGSPDGILSVGYDAGGRVCGKWLEYDPQAEPSHPERWPVWRRLVERSVPSRQPTAIYSPF